MRQFLLFLFLILAVEPSRRGRLFRKLYQTPPNNDNALSNVETVWYKNMKLDHFTWGDTRVFDMRVMWNNTFYKPGGPIFFYTGNEGGLETFVTATGIMFDLAPQFNASIIFAEHRFYGKTQPFGGDSYKTLANVGYLTSEQALADYAELLTELKRPDNQFNMTFQQNTQIISFGGSYGGMLSAWFRQKYPHIVKGAWAASAPLIYMHDGGVHPGAFDNITSRTYVDNGCNRFLQMHGMLSSTCQVPVDTGRQWLNNNNVFKLDPRTPIRNATDGWNLNSYLREAIEYMAMVDYPYPTGFLEPLPGWPVTVACGYMNATGTSFSDQNLVTAIANAANVYYNYNKDPNYTYCIDNSVCGDPGVGGLGGDFLGWPWQECSEIIMAMCSNGGTNDVFWPECGDNIYDTLKSSCVSIFGSMGWNTSNWNIDAVKTLYGYDLSGSSNLILTQGHLDPWSGGGYKMDQNNAARGIYVLDIPGSAHHLDLRQPNTCDPNTVTNARFQIVEILKCWVDPSCHTTPPLTDLPSISIPNVECKDVFGGYPWGQKIPDVTTSVGTSTTSTSTPSTSTSSTTRPTLTSTTTATSAGTSSISSTASDGTSTSSAFSSSGTSSVSAAYSSTPLTSTSMGTSTIQTTTSFGVSHFTSILPILLVFFILF